MVSTSALLCPILSKLSLNPSYHSFIPLGVSVGGGTSELFLPLSAQGSSQQTCVSCSPPNLDCCLRDTQHHETCQNMAGF